MKPFNKCPMCGHSVQSSLMEGETLEPPKVAVVLEDETLESPKVTVVLENKEEDSMTDIMTQSRIIESTKPHNQVIQPFGKKI